MRKIKKLFAVLVCALLSSCAAVSLVACGGGVKDNYIRDENTYRWANIPALKPEMDDGVKIDGEFDDPIYENIRWLEVTDRPDIEKSSEIRVGTAITVKGVYIAVDVEETGSNIYVNPNRASYCNSCIELYMDMASENGMTKKTLEFDLIADGSYSIRSRVPARGDWKSAYAPNDIAPVAAAKTKGGKVNSDTCYGYSYELFLSVGYLKKMGYEFSEDMEIALNPVHIISLDYNQTNYQLARVYSQWMANYSDNYAWDKPNTWLLFGKNGLQAYNVNTTVTGDKTLGVVTCTNGKSEIFKGHNGELKILCLNGSKLTKLTINGENSLEKVRWSGDVGYLTISSPSSDVEIEAEFSK